MSHRIIALRPMHFSHAFTPRLKLKSWPFYKPKCEKEKNRMCEWEKNKENLITINEGVNLTHYILASEYSKFSFLVAILGLMVWKSRKPIDPILRKILELVKKKRLKRKISSSRQSFYKYFHHSTLFACIFSDALFLFFFFLVVYLIKYLRKRFNDDNRQ